MELVKQTLKNVEDKEFYHEFLPRKDILSMLKRVVEVFLVTGDHY